MRWGGSLLAAAIWIAAAVASQSGLESQQVCPAGEEPTEGISKTISSVKFVAKKFSLVLVTSDSLAL